LQSISSQPTTGPLSSATSQPTTSARQPAAAAKDTTPPGPVTGLGLTGNTISSVTLGWTDPTDADLAHVVIRRVAGSTAPTAGQGTLVATLGTKATSHTDNSLASATAYSYALFAEDKAGNLSSATTVTAYTAATDAHTGLRGSLTDSAGKGIGNVLVHVRLGNGDAADAITSSTGTYSVTNLLPGTYYVCYEPKTNVGGQSISGYLPGCYHQQSYYGGTPVTVTTGALTSNVNDTLAPAAALTGRITGPDGSPIAGVVVTTTVNTPYAYLTSTTSTDGVYLFKNLQPNQYYNFCYDTSKAVGSSSDGYLGGCYYDYVNPTAGKLTTHDVTLNVGGVITGVVRDNNGNPVAGAKVFDATYGGNPAVTDANGVYRLAQRQPGTHNLCADGSAAPVTPAGPYGYLNECGYADVPVTAQLNQIVNQDLTVGQNGAVGGVLSRSDGSPSADAQVELFTADGYSADDARTDAYGHWQIDRPAGQYYACYVAYDTTDVWTCHPADSYNGGQPTGDPVTVAEGVLTPVNDTLLAGATVSGTVTGPDGAPLANALVEISDSVGYQHLQAVTDSAGHYSVAGLPAGRYLDCASVNQYQHQPGSPSYTDQCYGRTAADPYPYALSVSPGQRLTVNLQIALASEVEGRITDAAGNPISGVWVYFTNQAGVSGGQVTTDGNGEFDLFGLTPGDYTMCFSTYWAYPVPVTGFLDSCWQDKPAGGPGDPIHAVAGQVSTVNPVLASAGGVAGTVTDSSGNPVSSIEVTVVGSDGTTVGATSTDWQGNYQITGLPVTAVAVCIDPGWYGYQPVCYANAPDYRSATLVTLTAGTVVSGIDVQVTDSASPQVGVNRPQLARRVSRAA
jgi:Carboxypeptidase regulatory-like domain